MVWLDFTTRDDYGVSDRRTDGFSARLSTRRLSYSRALVISRVSDRKMVSEMGQTTSLASQKHVEKLRDIQFSLGPCVWHFC